MTREMTGAPLPALLLYTRAECELCDEARALLQALLAERIAVGRSAPAIEERDIESDPAWHREFFASIPVVEIGGRQLEIATSAAKLRRLLAEALDAPDADYTEAVADDHAAPLGAGS